MIYPLSFTAFLLLVWGLSSSYGGVHVAACITMLWIVATLVWVAVRWSVRSIRVRS